MLYQNIIDTIGRTPIVKLNRIAPKHVDMYVKLEAFNPGGSVKDRLAFAIINDAKQRGELKDGQAVIESTSGNTGIALAMVCAALGHPFIAVMPESFSIERRKLMKSAGAKVVLTPAAEKVTGAAKKAETLAKANGWFLANQFSNPANVAYHRQTTASEILSDFAGRRLDYFVSGYGTGGTMSGTGEVLKAARPNIEVVATEPETAQLLKNQDVDGKTWQPHKIQGWTPNFIADNVNREIYDHVIPVGDIESRDTALQLTREEGIFCGISGGGSLLAALKFADNAPKGSVILVMIPDSSERYLSTLLFEDISEASDEV